jgi:hypothetical protein
MCARAIDGDGQPPKCHLMRLIAAAVACVLIGASACQQDNTEPVPAAPAERPEFGQWHELIYHEGLGTTVLVNGGPESGQAADAPLELWSWDGQTWSLLSRDGPTWRNYAAVAYDSERDVVVVHGGLQQRSGLFDETWEWDGQTWRELADAGPGGREGAGMAYDQTRGRVVLYGGADEAGVHADTWSWDGTTWQRLASTGPPARFPSLMEYDPAREEVVLYGGHSIAEGRPSALADTWVWDGRSWQEVESSSAPGPRVNAPGAFHSGLGRMVMIGGGSENETLGDVWTWDGSMWSELPTDAVPRRQATGLAYDDTRDVVVLTGGLDRAGATDRYQDVWEWDGATFGRVYPD